MLLVVDECNKNDKKCVGVLAIPLENLPLLESKWIKKRIEAKMWQELKWEQLRESNNRNERYKPFIDLFFEFDMAFYCWSYKEPDSKTLKLRFEGNYALVFHKKAYSLIRNTSKKISWHNKYNGSSFNLYILFDKGTHQSQEQINKSRELLESDRKVSLDLNFIGETDSKTTAALQICDLLTGCANAEINNSFEDKAKTDFYNHVVARNRGKKFFLKRAFLPWNYFKIDCLDTNPIEPDDGWIPIK